jgi:hypothetical protein
VGSIAVERTFQGQMLVCLVLLLVVLFPNTRFLGAVALTTGLVFLALATGILFYGFAVDGTNRAVDKVLGILLQKLGKRIRHRLNPFCKIGRAHV